jgi:APA family basic amino acid/polyamine antiporter
MASEGTSTTGGGAQSPQVFARKASGLIRTASPFDVFGFNLLSGLIGISSLLMLVLIPAFYPGANLVVAVLIGALECLPLVMVYARLAGVLPRSGGDYVYMSRLLHPAYGFAANVGFTAAAIFVIGVGGSYLGQYGFGPLLRVAGAYWSSPGLVSAGTWLTEPLGVFLLGTVAIIGFGLLFLFGGMSVYWRVQTVLVIMASLSLLIIAVWALLVSRNVAFAHITQTLGNIGGKSLRPLAIGTSPDFSWSQTIKASIWPNFGIQGVFFSAYIGGEIKRPAKSQLIGMLVGLAWVAGWMAIICAVMVHLFGLPFFANLTTADMSQFNLSWTPAYEELSALGLGSGIGAMLLLVLFSAWAVTVVALNIAICSRTMFAWSVDRVVPAWLSRVSTGSHVPYNSIIVIMIAGNNFTAALSWKWITVLGGSYGFLAAYGGAAVCAVILAYRNPSLWKSSPGHSRFLGVPTTTWWGLLALPLGVGLPAYLLMTDPISGITPAHNFNQFIVFPIIMVVAGVGYYVSRSVQKRRGVNLDLNFHEIPPD